MKVNIVDKREMKIIGMMATGDSVIDININQLWKKFEEESTKIKGAILDKSYEIHLKDSSTPEQHYCMVGKEVKEIENLPLSMFVKVLPASKYAIFTHQFKDGGFGEAYRLINEWMDESDYTEAASFEIQSYDRRFKGIDDPESELDFYVPIKEK